MEKDTCATKNKKGNNANPVVNEVCYVEDKQTGLV